MNHTPHKQTHDTPLNLGQLLAFMGIDSEEEKILQEVAPHLVPQLPQIIDEFYNHLVAHEFTRSYFPSQAIVERLKTAQYGYLKDLLEHPFDEAYVKKRREIGKTHERIGLLPRWYIGAYAWYGEILFPRIQRAFPNDPDKVQHAQLAIMKVFYLDMQIAMETYIERYSHELISARRAMEQKLWMEDRILSFIMTEASDAFVGLDEHGRIVTWSQGASRIFGYPISEVIDKSLHDLVSDPQSLIQLRTEASAEGSATIYAMEWMTKNGDVITADTTMTMLMDESGVCVGSSLLLRNTTEIRRLADKVKNMEKLQAMTKITAGVAHEIRTPLGAITLMADLIGNRIEEVYESEDEGNRKEAYDEIKEMLADCQLEVDRLNEIVNHYLLLSRIKKPNKRPMNLNDYLREMAQELHKRNSEVQIETRPQEEEGPIYVEIDPDHFRRIFQNLFENAVYAMNQDGHIVIEAKPVNHTVRISFADNGSGISQEQLANVFNAFETNRPGGTGLGLYLVKEIVEAHQGEVSLKSEVGKGTTILIDLPIKEPPTQVDEE